MFTLFPAVLALACASFDQTPAFEVASVKRRGQVPAMLQTLLAERFAWTSFTKVR